MFNLEQSRYLINLITLDNLSMLNELDSQDTPNERKALLHKNLELSNQVFQAIVTGQGIKQNKVSMQDRVLLIDDTRNMLNVMRAFMEDIGFHSVDTASNGQEGWTMLKTHKNYGLVMIT